jgi:DNA-directed RNA polymerase subunit RPC12/RpoP
MLNAMSVLRKTSGVLVVRCLRCGHEAKLSRQVLARFGVKPDAPITAFVKRLRCSECGSGSVMAKRTTQPTADQGHRRRA